MQFDPIILIKTIGVLGLISVVFAESGLFFGFFLPGDSVLFSAGLLAFAGYLPLWELLVFLPAAAAAGDNAGYWFGKTIGPRLFSREDSFFFNKKYIEKTNAFYARHGKKTIILARFVPIVRTFAPILAGVGQMNYRTFLSYNIIGGLLWTEILVLAGYFIGRAVPNIDHYIMPAVLGIIVLSLLPIVFQIWRKK